MIYAVYGDLIANDEMCQKWSAKFNAGDFSLNKGPLSIPLNMCASVHVFLAQLALKNLTKY